MEEEKKKSKIVKFYEGKFRAKGPNNTPTYFDEHILQYGDTV